MSPAQPKRPPRNPQRDPRRGKADLQPAERRGRRDNVTQLDRRRPTAAPAKPTAKPVKRRQGLPRLPLFVAGLGLGYALHGLPALVMGAFDQPKQLIGSLVAPVASGDRRIVVLAPTTSARTPT